MSHMSLMVPSKLMKFHLHFPKPYLSNLSRRGTPPMAVATFGLVKNSSHQESRMARFTPNNQPVHHRSPHQTDQKRKRSDKNPALSVFLSAFPSDKFPLGMCALVYVCLVCGDIIPNQSDQYCAFWPILGLGMCFERRPTLKLQG